MTNQQIRQGGQAGESAHKIEPWHRAGQIQGADPAQEARESDDRQQSPAAERDGHTEGGQGPEVGRTRQRQNRKHKVELHVRKQLAMQSP